MAALAAIGLTNTVGRPVEPLGARVRRTARSLLDDVPVSGPVLLDPVTGVELVEPAVVIDPDGPVVDPFAPGHPDGADPAGDGAERSGGLLTRQAGRAERLLRSGSTALTVALVINGVADYVFLTASGRALGPELFTQISVLWAVLFLVGNGLYIPVEQELGRSISARRARGMGYGSLVQRVTIAAGVTFAVVAVVIAAFEWKISEALFRGDETLVWVLVFGIFGIAAMFLVRGWLAGTSRFHSYAALFIGDALAKALPPVFMVLAGVRNPVAYGLVMGASALVGCAVPFTRPREPMEAGPAPEWSPLMSSLGWLLVTSLLSALAMNIGTIAVEVLARPSEGDRAGVFLSGLGDRPDPAVPVPGHPGAGAARSSPTRRPRATWAGLRRSLTRLLTLLAGVTVVATVAAAWLGPIAVRVLFGEDFALLGGRDMALLTLASLLMMGALTINQAQIALHHQHQTGWPWGAACVVFVIIAALGGEDLFLQVELAMVATGLAVLCCSGALLWRELRHTGVGEHDLPAL